MPHDDLEGRAASTGDEGVETVEDPWATDDVDRSAPTEIIERVVVPDARADDGADEQEPSGELALVGAGGRVPESRRPDPERPSGLRFEPGDAPPAENGRRRESASEEEAPPTRRRRDDEPNGDGPKRGRRTGKQRVVLTLGIVAVVIVLLLAGGVFYVTKELNSIERKDVPLDAVADNQPLNILVVGSDSRDNVGKNDPDSGAFLAGGQGDGGGQRSDTIMIVRVNPQQDSIDVLSLPRDLWMPIAGSDENQRLNTAYSDSPQKLIATIKQGFGIDINHYVEVDFKGFKGIVDAVGGVPMYFDKPMRDGNSGLQIDKVGCQTLNGEQALAFARARHLQYKDDKSGWQDDPTGDIGRIARQQFFVKHIFSVVGKQVLTPDLRVAKNLLDAGVANVKVDRELDVNQMAALGKRFASKPDQIKNWSLPVTQYTTAGRASVVRMSADDATPILDIYRGLPEDAWPPESIKVTVTGATGVPGQADQVAASFKQVGFVVPSAADGKQVVKRTTIRHPIGYHRMAQEVARHLDAGADVVEDKTISDFTLVVTLGSDYKGTTLLARPLEEAAGPPPPVTVPTTAAGQKPVTTKAPTTTAPSTEYVLGGKNQVGVVPGEPPAGVTCDK